MVETELTKFTPIGIYDLFGGFYSAERAGVFSTEAGPAVCSGWTPLSHYPGTHTTNSFEAFNRQCSELEKDSFEDADDRCHQAGLGTRRGSRI